MTHKVETGVSVSELRTYFELNSEASSSNAAPLLDPITSEKKRLFVEVVPSLPLNRLYIDPKRVISSKELNTPKLRRGGPEVDPMIFIEKFGSSESSMFSSVETVVTASSDEQISIRSSHSAASSSSPRPFGHKLSIRELISHVSPRGNNIPPLSVKWRRVSLSNNVLTDLLRNSGDSELDGYSEVTSTKDASKLEHRVREHLRRMSRERSPSSLSDETLGKELKEYQKEKVDEYLMGLSDKKNPTSDSSSSPRTKQAVEYVLGATRASGVLTREIVKRVTAYRDSLKEYLRVNKVKTPWIVNLQRYFNLTINNQNNLQEFVWCIDGIEDEKISDIFKLIVGRNFPKILSLLQKWAASDVDKLLKPMLAKINLRFLNVDNIKNLKWRFDDEGVTPGSIAKTPMSDIIGDYVELAGAHLQYFSINEVRIDTASILKEGEEAQKSFFFYVLMTYYRLTGMSVGSDKVENEVEEMFNGGSVPSKEFLWMCTQPWKRFKEKVKVIFCSLSPHLTVIPDQDNLTMAVMVEEGGGYKITLAVNYKCYSSSLSEFDQKLQVDKSAPVAEIKFYWTVGPSKSPENISVWSGCIQIPEDVRVASDLNFVLKWKLLKQLINYSEIDKDEYVKEKDTLDAPEDIRKYFTNLRSALDDPSVIAEAKYVNGFILESIVKNLCVEGLNIANISSDEKSIAQYSKSVWSLIRVNGQVLEPLISRLRLFKVKLSDYVKGQAFRIEEMDHWFSFLDSLIEEKNIQFFLKKLEIFSENEIMLKTVLHAMCGGWQDKKGRINPKHQYEHVKSIINTLSLFNSGPQFLHETVKTILEGSKIENVHSVINQPHSWIFSQEKSTALLGITLEDVIRSLMPEETPVFAKLLVNGEGLDIKKLTGSKQQKRGLYFLKLFKAIYKKLDSSVTLVEIQKQVAYFLSCQGGSGAIFNEQIPCLNILRLCSISASQAGDRLFRYLFDVNNPPLKSSILPNSQCKIVVEEDKTVFVIHEIVQGIYPRGIPNEINSAIDKRRLLAKIPFLWVLVYSSDGELVRGDLKILDVEFMNDATSEERFLISHALQKHNTDFRDELAWEFKMPQPFLKSPLGIPEEIKNSNNHSGLFKKIRPRS